MIVVVVQLLLNDLLVDSLLDTLPSFVVHLLIPQNVDLDVLHAELSHKTVDFEVVLAFCMHRVDLSLVDLN